MMAENYDMLVADSDRAAGADELRRHYYSGRLMLDEFESRLDEVHAARTRSELEYAFRQLPRSEPSVSLRLRDSRWSSLAIQYVLVNLVCIAVWLFSGAHDDFWPKWIIVATLVMSLRRHDRRSSRLRK